MGGVIIAFYDNFDSACEAVQALVDKGFRPGSISMLAHEAACERNFRDLQPKSLVLLSQSCTIHLPGIGPVVVSGYFSNNFCAGETSQKSLVRVLQTDMIPERDAHIYTEGVRRRGVLVFVRAESGKGYQALYILDQYHPLDVQNLAERWRRSGWTHFDDKGTPLVNMGLNWPSNITSLPGDAFIYDANVKNWPQNMVPDWSDRDPWWL